MANMGFDLLWIKIDVQARAPRRGARSNLSLHSTPDLAKQAAASTKYPPCGRRSSGSGLPSFRWLGPESYADFADRNVLTTIIIIEEKRALEKTDALFVGANDLSYSYGKRVDMLAGGAAPLLKVLGKEGVDPKKAPLY